MRIGVMVKALIMQLYDYLLFPYRILALRTEFLENLMDLMVTFINMFMYKTLGTLLFFKREKKVAKEEATKI